jgi:hypothetical protein
MKNIEEEKAAARTLRRQKEKAKNAQQALTLRP